MSISYPEAVGAKAAVGDVGENAENWQVGLGQCPPSDLKKSRQMHLWKYDLEDVLTG